MNKFHAFLFALVLASLVSAGVAYVATDKHEDAHAVTTMYFTGITPETHLTLTGGYTDAVKYPSSEAQYYAYLGHSVNESVSYNLTPWLFAITFMITLGVVYGIYRDIE
jgi:hypothetical protein